MVKNSSTLWRKGLGSFQSRQKRTGKITGYLGFGQMNEPPGARARVALSGLTVAEYYRDGDLSDPKGGKDILFFIDNIFRFTQAGSEVSALLGRIPSAVGYQPTLATEMGTMQERITSTKGDPSHLSRLFMYLRMTWLTRRRLLLLPIWMQLQYWAGRLLL